MHCKWAMDDGRGCSQSHVTYGITALTGAVHPDTAELTSNRQLPTALRVSQIPVEVKKQGDSLRAHTHTHWPCGISRGTGWGLGPVQSGLALRYVPPRHIWGKLTGTVRALHVVRVGGRRQGRQRRQRPTVTAALWATASGRRLAGPWGLPSPSGLCWGTLCSGFPGVPHDLLELWTHGVGQRWL